jgi:hypothetical protein
MRVQLLTCLANPVTAIEAGEIIEVGQDEGARLIAAGVAVEVAPAPIPKEIPEEKSKKAREKR